MDYTGLLFGVGNFGYSWSTAVTETNVRFLSFSYSGISPENSTHRANALQLRCLQE
ncbi:MAG: hypothetical protein K2K83_07020 [Rikenella sp.]|nr:hypothetical protein [Rikenella sp.]